MNTVHDVNEFS